MVDDGELRLALVGQPNVGKTTLFNHLTGKQEPVGNHPGMTVISQEGHFYTPHGRRVSITDLPGSYSLIPHSPEEVITRNALLGLDPQGIPFDLLICVVDESTMERQMAFLLEICQLGQPIILVLNKGDLAKSHGMHVNSLTLSEELGVPIIRCQALQKRGLTALRQAIRTPLPKPSHLDRPVPSSTKTLLPSLLAQLKDRPLINNPNASALTLLADSDFDGEKLNPPLENLSADSQEREQIADDLFAHQSKLAAHLSDLVIHRSDPKNANLSDRLDSLALHPILGWGVFLLIMFGLFGAIFRFAEGPMGWIESGFGTATTFLKQKLPAGQFTDLLADGVLAGVGGVLVFLPQIFLLFFLLALLEGTGYISRAVVLVDRVMSWFGLSGKAFVPLLSGYACAIPAVLATRTISNAKERLVTILVLPWTSCSARLPVYLLLLPLLVSGSLQQTVWMFVIYLISMLSILLSAKFLSKTVGKSERSSLVLELPPYQWPNVLYALRHAFSQGLDFIRKAGTVILALSILLWVAQTFPKAPPESSDSALAHSFMGKAGEVLEPLVAPLGWDGKMGAAVLTSFAAREVFVASLGVMYSIDEGDGDFDPKLRNRLQKAKRLDGSLLFDLPTVLSLLVFFIYALQCLPTSVVVGQETASWKWAIAQFLVMSTTAYVAALAIYQITSRVL